MAIDTEKTLSRIYEANVLLNSNMFDAMQAAKESKEVAHEVLKELDLMYKGTEKSLQDVKEDLSKKLLQLENDFKSELFTVTNNSLHKITNDNADLKKATKFLYEDHQKILQKLEEQQEQIIQSLHTTLDKSVRVYKDFIEKMQNNIESNLEVLQKEQKSIFIKLAELNNTLNTTNETLILHNETMISKLDEHTKQLKKNQRTWFIVLFIAIFFGYFM
ncbi:hypothetical protein [Ureibacillus sp. FSL K6-2830]|uniref:hypothetical protein n=1 Tax=Ureibacillus sp. FSL K6-2830 TaxID=2954610 RepID=UPI0030F74B86